MEPDPQDPVAALVKVLEGWAAGQERQAAEHTKQLELQRVQAGLQSQALLQLAGGGGNSKEKTQKIHLPKMSADNDAQAFMEAFEVAAKACHWPREEWVVCLLSLLSGRHGVLVVVRTARPLPPRVPAPGGGAGGPGGWPAYLCSWFGGGVLHSGKGARE